MMDEQILRVLRGEATEIEVRQLDRWRADAPGNERTFQDAKAIWALTARTPDHRGASADAARMREEGEDRRRRNHQRASRRAILRSPWVGYGVAAAAVVALTFLGLDRSVEPSGVGLLAPVGSMARGGDVGTLALSDGSTVRLGRASRVDFPSRADRRAVVLEGKAFFAVASDPTPFVVSTDVGEVTVHGTRFEVNSLSDTMRVVVVEGRVEVENTLGSVLVTRGQVVRVTPTSAPQVVDHPDVWSLLDWPGGLLVYQGTPLDEVASELSRHFGRSFDVDPSVEHRRVTAWFEDESLEEVVDAVCMVVDARCEVSAEGVVIAR